MGLYSGEGGLIIGRILAYEISGAYHRDGLFQVFFLAGGWCWGAFHRRREDDLDHPLLHRNLTVYNSQALFCFILYF